MARPIVHTLFVFLLVHWTMGQVEENALNFLNGLQTYYKHGDETAMIVFKLWPQRSKIYYIKCNCTYSTYQAQVPAFTWQNSQLNIVERRSNIKEASMNNDIFNVTLSQPGFDKALFFCVANTLADKDIRGVATVSRKTDPLQHVDGSKVALHQNQTDAILRWVYFPQRADLTRIQCNHKSMSNRWREVCELNVRQDRFKAMGNFLMRTTHTFSNREFTLLIQQMNKADLGTYSCQFTSEGTPLPVHSSSFLEYFNDTSTRTQTLLQPQQASSVMNIVWPVLGLIIGFILGILAILGYQKRKQIRCKRRQNNTKEDVAQMDSLIDESAQRQAEEEMQETSKMKKKKRGPEQKLKYQTSVEQEDIREEPETPVTEEPTQAKNQEFIAVSPHAHSDDVICLCLDEDNTLPLESLKPYFPGAVGLTQTRHIKAEQKELTIGVLCKEGKLWPPKGGWGGTGCIYTIKALHDNTSPVVDIQSRAVVSGSFSQTIGTPQRTSEAVQPAKTPPPGPSSGIKKFSDQNSFNTDSSTSGEASPPVNAASD